MIVYRYHRDIIAGIYLFNPDNQNSSNFVNDLLDTARRNDFFGFEGEYYIVLRAAKHYGVISSLIFNSIPNPFSEIGLQEERQKIIERQIKSPLKKLVHTSVCDYINDSLMFSQYLYMASILLEKYNPEKVKEVCNIMNEVLINN